MSVGRLSRVLGAVVLALVSGPGLAVAEYACSMSGEVSNSCCCAPESGDGCPSIQRACACCDVSYASSGSEPDQPATTTGTSSPTTVHTALLSAAAAVTIVPAHVIGPMHPAEFVPSPPLGLYLLKSSLLR